MQIPFVRGPLIDRFGKKRMIAFKKNWGCAGYVEPDLKILRAWLSDLYEPEEGLVPPDLTSVEDPFE
jgi:hypothetical protein